MVGRKNTNPTTQAAKAIHHIVNRGSVQDPLYGDGRLEVAKTFRHHKTDVKFFYFKWLGESYVCTIEKR